MVGPADAYQGVAAPVARSEQDFDPGAKYHVPANYPYTRYFLARILQFQFHRALCEAAGQRGPLHRCSIYGSSAAGERLQRTLAHGGQPPWPDALEALTGGRQMDATAIVDYFAPLKTWLDEQNRGQPVGWEQSRSAPRFSPNASRSTARLLGTAVSGGSLPSISSETHPLKPAFCRMRAMRG